MHYWGDDSVDWKGIDEAGQYIGRNLKRYGRVSVFQVKEKFGEVVVACSLGVSSLLQLTHPGYCYYKPYPKWLMRLDIYVISPMLSPLNYMVMPYHKWLYRYVYKLSLRKWPHLKCEILGGAEWPCYLRGLGDSNDGV